MTPRGDRTRAKLIEATLAVVAEVGYAHASTRAIASAAGVSEGTIYRHFPDKAALFFAAALEPSASVLDGLTGLPALAGQRTVAENLVDALVRLGELQERVIPLEIAVLSDPELAAQRQAAAELAGGIPAGPPQAITIYLREEQRLGRIRPELDPGDVAVLLLATLFGLAVTAKMTGRAIDDTRIEAAVTTLVQGIAQP
ncbi:MAG TPA: helix-turn-helix domain-containing protein [Patescibacteria group bacterium]|nr:helix-turn-helix domain-containing protein [Patescibacteria group bacterium]